MKISPKKIRHDLSTFRYQLKLAKLLTHLKNSMTKSPDFPKWHKVTELGERLDDNSGITEYYILYYLLYNLTSIWRSDINSTM